jgi:hypothetical protein
MPKSPSSFVLCLALLAPGLLFVAADCQTVPAMKPTQTAPAQECKSAIRGGTAG